MSHHQVTHFLIPKEVIPMAQLNRRCMACSTKYSYCPDCSRADALKPAWYSEFCSEPCKDLWLTLTRYNMSRLSKSEAKEAISSLELKPIDVYVACVQRDYAKVMAEEKKPKRGKHIEIKPIDEVADVKPTIVEKIIEQVVEESHEVVVEKENE
jgi:hypothetical protein